jgi:hypothetical protein
LENQNGLARPGGKRLKQPCLGRSPLAGFAVTTNGRF